MSKKPTNEELEEAICFICKEDGCCEDCSFFDSEGKFYPRCHDCGREFEESEVFEDEY